MVGRRALTCSKATTAPQPKSPIPATGGEDEHSRRKDKQGVWPPCAELETHRKILVVFPRSAVVGRRQEQGVRSADYGPGAIEGGRAPAHPGITPKREAKCMHAD